MEQYFKEDSLQCVFHGGLVVMNDYCKVNFTNYVTYYIVKDDQLIASVVNCSPKFYNYPQALSHLY